MLKALPFIWDHPLARRQRRAALLRYAAWQIGSRLKTDVEVKEEQDRENGFKSGLSKIPDQKAKIDPWGNVRGSTPPSQGQAKQAPK